MNKSGSQTRAHTTVAVSLITVLLISNCNDPVTTGYTYAFTDKTYDETATVACATGYEGTVYPGQMSDHLCLGYRVWLYHK